MVVWADHADRRVLEGWLSLADFIHTQRKIFATVGERDYRDNRYKWLREGWVVGRLAVALSADSLRLSADPPDAEIRTGMAIWPIEIVEALDPDRKPHGDLKSEIDRAAATSGEWDAEDAELSDLLVRSRSKKEDQRHYGPGTVLLIYLNAGHAPRSADKEFVSFLTRFVSEGSPKFHAVCVLWKNRIYGPGSFVPEGVVALPSELSDV